MIVYQDSADGITVEQLGGGFFAGWTRPLTPELHLKTLHGNDLVVLAVDEATGQVVGYVTALTDGVLSAFIPNLEVLAAYQGQGIGTALMRRLLEQLAPIPNIDLICDPDVEPFYERLGMQRHGGMIVRKPLEKIGF